MSEVSDITLVMVDDNSDEIFLTRRLIRREGIINNFVSERKPERLLDTLAELDRAGVPRDKILILMDVKMPRVNGFEALQKLRANKAFKDIPVIMLSASDDEADMFEALDVGADGYIVKPFRGDEFFAALSNVPKVKHQLVQ